MLLLVEVGYLGRVLHLRLWYMMRVNANLRVVGGSQKRGVVRCAPQIVVLYIFDVGIGKFSSHFSETRRVCYITSRFSLFFWVLSEIAVCF